MKPQYIKYMLLILISLPIATIATEPQIPSGEAKQAFANCVINEKNSWSACYHHLRPTDNDQDENFNIEEILPSPEYAMPRWAHWVLPTFNPPDYSYKTSSLEDGASTVTDYPN